MKKFPLFYATVLSLPLLILAGCDGMNNQRTTNPTAASDGQKATTAYIDDSVLKRDVTTALQRDPVFSNGDITVSSLKGQITLTGFVATREDITKAADIAKKVQGVTGVTNSLILKPASTVG